jgi:hypothetical protein
MKIKCFFIFGTEITPRLWLHQGLDLPEDYRTDHWHSSGIAGHFRQSLSATMISNGDKGPGQIDQNGQGGGRNNDKDGTQNNEELSE